MQNTPPAKKAKVHSQSNLNGFLIKPNQEVASKNTSIPTEGKAIKYTDNIENVDDDDDSQFTASNANAGTENEAMPTSYPSCWSSGQYQYFSDTYPWLFCDSGKVGCSTCREVKNLGLSASKCTHLATEWLECRVSVTGDKSSAQKSLRKKIAKHAQSQAHSSAALILETKKRNPLEKASARGASLSKQFTEKCLRTAYFIGYKNRPFSDYPDLIDLQIRNGVNLGSTLHSRYSCTEMLDCISGTMRSEICNLIISKERKVSIITDESTSLSKKSCLIVYLRAIIAEKPLNIFLDLCELIDGQGASSICSSLLESLGKHGFDKAYLSKHLVGFTSDGASVMLGVKSGVGQRLKDQFPGIILWHCLNHRLELAVADAISTVSGFFSIQALFEKIYCVYSRSAKHQRQIQEISMDLDIQFKRIGKIFTIRWVASSFRTVKALWENYPALYMHFKQLADDTSTKTNDRAAFRGLSKKLATTQFVEDVAIVKDCLAQVSILSESLQKPEVSFIEANRYLKYTINGLMKIKTATEDGKYSSRHMVGEAADLKGIPLETFSGRSGYTSFGKEQFVQALIDNINSRMLSKENDTVLKQMEALIPDRWPTDIDAPWFEGEAAIEALCQRFHLSDKDIKMAYREYINDPRKVPSIIDKRLIQGLLYIVPVSSSEAERGFSQMNLICTPMRSNLAITHISSLLFVNINGPPPNMWDAEKALTKWLLYHRAANDNQTRKTVFGWYRTSR